VTVADASVLVSCGRRELGVMVVVVINTLLAVVVVSEANVGDDEADETEEEGIGENVTI
jgi:hypothetical protein